MSMIQLDGRSGEGGGQILRTALSLSLVTGQPFRMTAIRARRRSPGLMRQHLTAVQAAAEVGQASVEGAAIGSTELSFRPGSVRPGDYSFATGTAGSTTLIFQTLLPALLRAAAPSTLLLAGGTHNPMAPTFEFLDRVFLPVLGRLGARVEASLLAPGFYPAGGGQARYQIAPWTDPAPLTLLARGAVVKRSATALLSAVPFSVAERELQALTGALSWEAAEGRPLVVRNARGPGNVLWAQLDCEHVTELMSSVGERGKPAEAVAGEVVAEVRAYLAHGAPVGEHLADQLLLPLALGRGGVFRTGAPSQHTLTQIETIRYFLGVTIRCEQAGEQWEIEVR